MKQRVTTAVIIIAIALPILIYGGLPFVLLGVLTTLLATQEMIGMRETTNKVPLEIKLFTMVSTLLVVFHSFDLRSLTFTANSALSIEIMSLVLFVLLLAVVIRQNFTSHDAGYFLLTILYVGSTFHAMLFVRMAGLNLFLFVILVVALTDTFAYFIGRKLGKRKLAPLISPKKTVEGSVGGTLVGTLAGVVFGLVTGLIPNILVLTLVSFIVSLVGQVGDLVASALKREYKIKDYGKIFPGHGGVMDRLDSQLFASLALYIVLNLFNVVI